MDVWMTWCRRTAKCAWCSQPIPVTTEMLIKKYWRKGDPEQRKWNIKFYYHPDCYLAEGRDYLRRNPYTAAKDGRSRGRPIIKLSAEDKRQRYLLLRRKASLEQRKKQLRVSGLHIADQALKEAQLNEKIAELMGEINKVGGIPASWLV